MTLEEEIQNATIRINSKTTEFEQKISDLENKIRTFTRWAWGFVIGGFIIVLLGLSIFLCPSMNDFCELNLLGDFYGGSVASIWSLAGLFFIYVAFLGQKQQLLSQQMEIMYSQLEVKYTRFELEGQKLEMQQQNATLKQQRFENTFFQLITLFNSIVNTLDLRDRQTKQVTTSGRECFKVFYDRFRSNVVSEMSNSGNIFTDLNESPICETIEGYDKLYDKEKADLSHYFRTIYRIYKFIDDSEIENKNQYAAIARAQLSSYEQILLFYNCLHKNGRNKFKKLIEIYAVFNNLDESLLINNEHLKEYEDSAYGHENDSDNTDFALDECTND